MSQVEIERLDRALREAQADLEEAERLLVVDPTDELAQMSVELFRSEVASFRQILAAPHDQTRLGRCHHQQLTPDGLTASSQQPHLLSIRNSISTLDPAVPG